MTESTITAKGQTTAPVHIRQTIGSVPGTRWVWHVLSNGRVFVWAKIKTSSDVKGMVKVPKGKRLSIEEMRP